MAEEAGINPKYLSTVLNGHCTPKKAEEKLFAALERIKRAECLEDGSAATDDQSLADNESEKPDRKGRLI